MYNFFKEVMYYKDDNVQMISLSYITEILNFKMIIILPNNNKYSSPLNYLKGEKINLNHLISKLLLTNSVNLYLPVFVYEFNFSLNQLLQKLNMKKAFTSIADFRKIFNIKSIKIYEIIHKTFIQINEQVTESIVTQNKRAFSLGEDILGKINMNVNNSFIYAMISDDFKDSQGNFLMPFIGVVNNLQGNIIKEIINIYYINYKILNKILLIYKRESSINE